MYFLSLANSFLQKNIFFVSLPIVADIRLTYYGYGVVTFFLHVINSAQFLCLLWFRWPIMDGTNDTYIVFVTENIVRVSTLSREIFFAILEKSLALCSFILYLNIGYATHKSFNLHVLVKNNSKINQWVACHETPLWT